MGRVPTSIGRGVVDFLVLLVVLPGFTLTLILLSPLYLWRLTVKLLAKCFRAHHLDGMLSELDAFFLFNDSRLATRPEFVISILVTLEGEVDYEQFKSNLYNDIVNARHETGGLIYGRLQQRLTTWLGFPFFEWIPEFRIGNHVGMSEVKVLVESKHEWVASRVREPFPADGALWDLTLAPSLSRTFVNLRVHHAVSDGFSIIKTLMTRGMKINPNEFIFPRKCLPKQESTCSQKLSKGYRNTVAMPGKYVRKNLELKRRNPFQNPHSSSFSGKVLVGSTGKIPLQYFKRAKLRLGIPFTAILNSAISAGLRNYLQKVESATTTEKKKGFRTQSLKGVTFVPMPRHPDDAILNWCGITDMKISLEGDNLDRRLEIANAQFKSTLASPYLIAHYYWLKVMGNLPATLAKGLLSGKSTGFLYSNMSGPTASGHLWNNFMSDVMFWNPLVGSNGVAFSILSYNEYVKIGIAADSNVIKGSEKLREMTELVESELTRIFNLETV